MIREVLSEEKTFGGDLNEMRERPCEYLEEEQPIDGIAGTKALRQEHVPTKRNTEEPGLLEVNRE